MSDLHYDLYKFARNGNVEMLKSLTDKGVDMNAQTLSGNTRWTPLHAASIRGDLDLVESLLKTNKIDVNSQDDVGMTALHVAVMYGFTKVVEALLKSNKINVNLQENKYEWSPLHVAAQRCIAIGRPCIDLVEALLKSNKINKPAAKEREWF